MTENKEKEEKIVIMVDDISGLLQGCDSQNPDIDFIEIINHFVNQTEETDCILTLGVNRDLLFNNQKPIFRDLKNNDFDFIFEINRNSAGYN